MFNARDVFVADKKTQVTQVTQVQVLLFTFYASDASLFYDL